jgi:hypothetical protein
MAKRNTNSEAGLIIVGIVLALIAFGIATWLTNSLVIGIAMFIIILSGVFGKKPMVTITSLMAFLAISIVVTHLSGEWWQWLVCLLTALFISNVIASFRPNQRQERLEFDNELSYDLFIKDRNFAIKFPKKPKLITDTDDVKTYRYDDHNHTDSLTFSVSIAHIKTPKNEEKLYEDLGYTMGVLQGDGHQIYSDDKSKMLDVPCYTGIFENPDGSIFYRKIFIKKTNRYVLTFGTNQANEALFNKFVDSFRFIKS